MSELLSGFIGAGTAAVAGLLVVGTVRFVKRRIRLTSPHTEAVDAQGKEIAQLKPLVLMLVTIQKPQLVALLGLLGSQKKKMNGNFKRAYNGVKSALNDFDEALMKIVRGECYGQKTKPDLPEK